MSEAILVVMGFLLFDGSLDVFRALGEIPA